MGVIRNADLGDLRESIRRKINFPNDSRESRQTCDSQFLVPQNVIRTKEGFSSESGTLIQQMRRVARICELIHANPAIQDCHQSHVLGMDSFSSKQLSKLLVTIFRPAMPHRHVQLRYPTLRCLCRCAFWSCSPWACTTCPKVFKK